MGIFGAMTTAISGLRAQSYALERISDNIANSQTTGYKRSDTSFVDFVPESPPNRQSLGVVNAFSRPTNSIQGDINTSEIPTYMAINGDGYFIVAIQTDTIDGVPVFGSENLYTRRGDFVMDQSGYLVNGSGYFLMGVPIDPSTGNPIGSLPSVIQVSNDFIPASATTRIDYRANLASNPLTTASSAGTPGSELLNVTLFSNDPTAGGDGFVQGQDVQLFLEQSLSGGAVTAFDPTGAPINVQFRWAKLSNNAAATPATFTGSVIADPNDLGSGITGFDDVTNTNDLLRITVNSVDYDFNIGTDLGEVNTLSDLVNAINAMAGLNTFVTASQTGGRLVLTANDTTTSFTVGGDANAVTGLGLTAGTYNPGPATTDTWNLFYLSDSSATGTDPAWRNVGIDYVFAANGQLNPAIGSVLISNLTINGVNLGDITLNHGVNGITQFADPNGVVKVTNISQNGFSAGELLGIFVSDEGRIVARYTNGRSIDVAEVTLASFNGDSWLAKADGGAFRATPQSGAPILGALGRIVGSALEGSNTDIADEFTKLIVTQQAYAANTRIVTTGNQMIQEALNMIR